MIQDDSQQDGWRVGNVMHQDDGEPEQAPAGKIGDPSPVHVNYDASRV